jgi:hypothetical protein
MSTRAASPTALDPALREQLAQLPDSAELAVLVYPRASDSESLIAYLSKAKERGDAAFNLLALAGCIAVKARRPLLLELASRGDVASVTLNPTFRAGG